MRSALLASSLLATLVLSKPLAKREYVTETELVVVYTTVTIPSAEPTTDPGTTTVATVTVTSGDTPAPTVEPTTEAPAPDPTTAAPAPDPTTSEISQPSRAAAAPAAPAASGANAYQNMVLTQHNLHRANHSAPALVWNDQLESIAQEIASSCKYAHNTAVGGISYGQNIGAGTTSEEVGGMITNLMYNGEINFYPPPFGNKSPDMTNFEKWGHFSQIVWKSTTSMACFTQYCPNGLANTGGNIPPYFTVCNYSPPGNFAGEYNNVGAPLGQASITA